MNHKINRSWNTCRNSTKKAGHKDITTTMNIYNTVLSEREKEVNKNIERQFDEKGLTLSNFIKKT